MKRPLSLVALAIPLLLASSNGWALFGNEDLERRIERIEQRLGGDNSSDMVVQMESLQREIQQLRGELEIQQHALDAMHRRQQDLYNDLDQRLGGGGGRSSGSVPPPMVSDPSQAFLPAPEPAMDNSPIRADREPVPTAPAGPIVQAQTADPHQEAAYKTAFEQLKSGQYGKATQSFKGFINTYPAGVYADNAQYWLGEAYYVQRDYDNALAEFDKVLKNYPRSAKVPDALLKMGYIQSDKANWKQANELLGRLVKDYPDSTSAGLGRKQLERLRREGH